MRFSRARPTGICLMQTVSGDHEAAQRRGWGSELLQKCRNPLAARRTAGGQVSQAHGGRVGFGGRPMTGDKRDLRGRGKGFTPKRDDN